MGGVIDSKTSDVEIITLAECGLSFEAIDTRNDFLVGVLLCTTHKKGEKNAHYEEIFRKAPMDEKFKKINDLTDLAKDLAEPIIRKDDKANEYLEGVMICVHPNYSGQGIAKQLLTAMESLAKERSIKVTYVGCSSEFTSRAMIKLGYQEIVNIPYSEYRHEKSQVGFENVQPPHIAYRGFMKLILD